MNGYCADHYLSLSCVHVCVCYVWAVSKGGRASNNNNELAREIISGPGRIKRREKSGARLIDRGRTRSCCGRDAEQNVKSQTCVHGVQRTEKVPTHGTLSEISCRVLFTASPLAFVSDSPRIDWSESPSSARSGFSLIFPRAPVSGYVCTNMPDAGTEHSPVSSIPPSAWKTEAARPQIDRCFDITCTGPFNLIEIKCDAVIAGPPEGLAAATRIGHPIFTYIAVRERALFFRVSGF